MVKSAQLLKPFEDLKKVLAGNEVIYDKKALQKAKDVVIMVKNYILLKRICGLDLNSITEAKLKKLLREPTNLDWLNDEEEREKVIKAVNDERCWKYVKIEIEERRKRRKFKDIYKIVDPLAYYKGMLKKDKNNNRTKNTDIRVMKDSILIDAAKSRDLICDEIFSEKDNKGRIVFVVPNLAEFVLTKTDKMITNNNIYISEEIFDYIVSVVVSKVLYHELFHHLCEFAYIMRGKTGYRYIYEIEEALANAFSKYVLDQDRKQISNKNLFDTLLKYIYEASQGLSGYGEWCKYYKGDGAWVNGFEGYDKCCIKANTNNTKEDFVLAYFNYALLGNVAPSTNINQNLNNEIIEKIDQMWDLVINEMSWAIEYCITVNCKSEIPI